MHLRSFIKSDLSLKPIDVEIALVPGLPQISIIGLPDQMIKESAKRVQTALTNQGYLMPKAKQILINLNPREIKKTSLGIDLAMALGILAESGQRIDIQSKEFVYGGLHLSGEVFAPPDIERLGAFEEPVITGGPSRPYAFPAKVLKSLSEDFELHSAEFQNKVWIRPALPVAQFSKPIAHLLKMIAVGEHSVILAGPPGGGKSTFVEAVSALIAPPRSDVSYLDSQLPWRPVRSPHHSTSSISMVGGGVPLSPGDIVRAHGGVLILEELLEFHPQVQSALREPLEKGYINVSRGLRHTTFPARCLALATTNLCRCGDFSPLGSHRCRCSSLQLRRYLEKFTGPFVDRFSCLLFTQDWKTQDSLGDGAITGEQVLKDCERAREFIEQSRNQLCPNQELSEAEIIKTFERTQFLEFLPIFRSHRRRVSLLKIARTLADLEECEKIQMSHLSEAQRWTYDPFLRVRDMLN